ncbi:MAG TPA: helix-turn-helix transcriptional regulator [Gemmatimonadaceae bacterium]|nr:helix-turn-helix transcriptional regulator [Gemmatimonadaceae bacterium]
MEPDISPAGAREIFRTGSHKVYRPVSRDELHAQYGITKREADVARQVANGRSNAEIARVLRVSVHTIRRHVEHVLVRLGVRRRTEVWSKLLTTR